ncbi:ATP-binding protein [Sinorhizobium fredii]|uniref:histidine kinase n=2 Tax=Sinorhizobium TaxID=28105 RepID=A0A2S3YTF4_9HYPH|nr:ATP-binding protein [Sinorhizobium fredii]AUX80608.1 sensor histidine kinase protein [Sinorhizobium fredii]PDT37496.1 two-component sensor histidine kinase [Sinorhizobium sp. FG01]POH34911.1 two-component sensor histidine kinase [Sinorhizobium americanum]
MFARFQAGSIRRQIAALAVGPVICLVMLGVISELLLRDDLESVSYARTTALKIETVVDQVRASTSAEQRAAILDATSGTGLRVEQVSAAELLKQADTDISFEDVRHLVQNNLPASFATAFRAKTSAGKLHDVLVVGVGDDRALAFLPAPPPPDAWISDQQVSIVLQLMGLVLPVVLLSLYAARVIAAPLLKFAQAAETLKPDDGPDRPFNEGGVAEIRTLAKSLNDMRSRVRSMIDDRTRMLRAISHDLRTPLTRLRLRAERSTQPELKAALLNDISALSDMVNDTLSYLSKEMAAEKPVNADLPSLLTTVCSDFSDVGFNVRYVGPERFAYRCKPRSLARAITNLVENSTKFAHEISVELSILGNGSLRICVIDDGPGLPVSLRTRVLEPFFKADTARTSTDRGGFGLGLSIVDDIVRAHGGTIELLNRAPQGLAAQMDFPTEGHAASGAAPKRTTGHVGCAV